MKTIKYFVLGAFATTLILTLVALKAEKISTETQSIDSLADDRAKYLKLVRASIKGNGKKAADSVFKNIKILKGMPAGQLLAVMDIAYSQSLGVSCGHCHNTSKWESDEKPQKQIAREMSILLKKTKELIKDVKGLKSENPTINCTTCHRGAIKPALDLGEK